MKRMFDSGRRRAMRAPVAALSLLGAYASSQAAIQTIDQRPLPASPEEDRILKVIAEVHRGHRYLSVPESDGRLLRVLVEAIDAKHVVELGTSTGYSGLWMLLALTRTGGRLTSYEIDRGRHQLARDNFERAGVLSQATLVLGDAHIESTRLRKSIDLLFIDADKEGYFDYLTELGPMVRPGGLIAAHNMAFPPPDPRYVRAVTTSPAYETVFLNMHEAGIGVTLKKR